MRTIKGTPYLLIVAQLFLFLPTLVPAQSNQLPTFAKWYQQTSSDGFSAAFPTKPVYSVEDQNFPNFNTKFHRYIDQSHKYYYFEVGYAEYPPAVSSKAQLFDVLATALKSKLGKLGVTIQYQKEIVSGNCVGQETSLKSKTGSPMKVRNFMSGNFFYQLTTGSDFRDEKTNRIIDHFLNSFAVLGGCNDRIASVAAPSTEVKHSVLDGILDSVTGWRKIISARDGIEMLMPTSAKLDEEDVSMGLPLMSRTFLSTSDTAIYYVNATGDFPPGFIKSEDLQVGLDLIEKNLGVKLESIHPQITLSRNLKLGAYGGREYRITANGRLGKAQTFITAKRTYLIIASDTPENYSASNVDTFLGSIRISTN